MFVFVVCFCSLMRPFRRDLGVPHKASTEAGELIHNVCVVTVNEIFVLEGVVCS